MSGSPTTHLAGDRQIVQIIWAAFLGSLAVYAAVLYVVAGSGPPLADPTLLATLRRIFAVVAVGLAFAGFAVRRRLTATPAAGTTATKPSPGSAGVAARLRTGCIVTWALSEAVAAFGLVLGILGQQTSEFVPFAVAAAVLLYLHRPAVWPFEAAAGNPAC